MAHVVLQLSGKPFHWDAAKNARLIAQRQIAFEEVILAVEQDGLLDLFRHWNLRRYPNQWILVVAVRGYAYLVPLVEDTDHLFLKTIIPSRRATRRHLSHGTEKPKAPDVDR